MRFHAACQCDPIDSFGKSLIGVSRALPADGRRTFSYMGRWSPGLRWGRACLLPPRHHGIRGPGFAESVVAFERPFQPCAGHRPVALDRGWRGADSLRRFLHGQPAEVAELDEMHLIGIDRSQAGERFVQREEVDVADGPERVASAALVTESCRRA